MFQLLPVNQVRAHGVPPRHIVPNHALWIMLKKEVVLALVVNQPIRIVNPVLLCREMELWTMGLSV